MKVRLIFLVLAGISPLHGAPDRLNRDLGRGLGYCRVHVLPADLPATAPPGALVLDLRYVHADGDAGRSLTDWFNSRTTHAPLFVLVNAGTDPVVLDYFASRMPTAGVITLGEATARFAPDIALKIAAPAERAAYDALEKGAPLETLLTDNSTKPRHDEASIAQDRVAATDESQDADPLEPPPVAPAPPPPLIDQALLRAVHLHRTLLALRRM